MATAVTRTNAILREPELVGDGLRGVQDIIEKSRRLEIPILLSGPTGAGKGLVAEIIHKRGTRRKEPFMTVNCAALPQELVETELFGCEHGAYTGAIAHLGAFQRADRGTIFLDEISVMDLRTQAKFLGVLDTFMVRKIGGWSETRVDVQVIAATNQDLKRAVQTGAFREDLYYRLHVLPLCIPPLRDRKEDIFPLIQHFLALRGEYYSPACDVRSLAKIESYSWPGNVRELRNVIDRALIISNNERLSLQDIAQLLPEEETHACGEEREDTLAAVEKKHILRIMERYHWKPGRASAMLGICRKTLSYKLKDYGICPEKTDRSPF